MKFNKILFFIAILISGISMNSFAAESKESDSEKAMYNIALFYKTNYPNFGNIEIILAPDGNYFVKFENEDKAKLFSDNIAKFDIKGSSGHNKYVAQHYLSYNYKSYGIILTPKNLETLHYKVKLANRQSAEAGFGITFK